MAVEVQQHGYQRPAKHPVFFFTVFDSKTKSSLSIAAIIKPQKNKIILKSDFHLYAKPGQLSTFLYFLK